jgi:hypothetical protein
MIACLAAPLIGCGPPSVHKNPSVGSRPDPTRITEATVKTEAKSPGLRKDPKRWSVENLSLLGRPLPSTDKFTKRTLPLGSELHGEQKVYAKLVTVFGRASDDAADVTICGLTVSQPRHIHYHLYRELVAQVLVEWEASEPNCRTLHNAWVEQIGQPAWSAPSTRVTPQISSRFNHKNRWLRVAGRSPESCVVVVQHPATITHLEAEMHKRIQPSTTHK